MEGNVMLLLPILVPVVVGALVLSVKGLRRDRRILMGIVTGTLAAGCILTFWALYKGGQLAVWRLSQSITIGLSVDGVSRIFAALTCVVWLLAGIYSVSYMVHEKDEFRFFGFYLIVLGVLIGLDFSANLVTLYVFFEMMTLTSLPLVLHEMTREAVMAGLKYLFYSVAGAFLALFGIFSWRGQPLPLPLSRGAWHLRIPWRGMRGCFWFQSAVSSLVLEQRPACSPCTAGFQPPIQWPRRRPAPCCPA